MRVVSDRAERASGIIKIHYIAIFAQSFYAHIHVNNKNGYELIVMSAQGRVRSLAEGTGELVSKDALMREFARNY